MSTLRWLDRRPLRLVAILTLLGLAATAWHFAADTGAAGGPQPGAQTNCPPQGLPVAAKRPTDGKLRILAFGAHPDDCELKVGGTAAMWAAAGQHVKFVSVCNGDLGHSRITGGPLALRRRAEVEAAAKILGIEATEVLDIHDGELMPTLENRMTITRLMRQWNPDIVFSHRPNDYMADHRAAGTLVQDASFLVIVPFWCPLVPYLTRNPVILYFDDSFRKPTPFAPDIVVSIDGVIDQRVAALLVIESQFIEGGCCGALPKDAAGRAAIRQQRGESFRKAYAAKADRFRAKLIELYGEEEGKKVRYAEAFELCEYGRQPTPDELRKLFPLPPKR